MRDIDRSQLRKTLTLSIFNVKTSDESENRKEELRVRMEKELRNADCGKQEIAGKKQRQTSDSPILTRDLPVHTEPSETRRITAIL